MILTLLYYNFIERQDKKLGISDFSLILIESPM